MTAVDPEKNSPAQITAFGGILAAACLICLFIATLLPTNRIFFYGLSSVFIAPLILKFGIKSGGVFFGATSLLAILLIPNKIRVIPYLFILGHYGIWKTLIERQNHPIREIMMKLLVLNIGAAAAYYFMIYLLFEQIAFPYDLKLVIIALQVVFLVYDYAFTFFIRFYLDKIR